MKLKLLQNKGVVVARMRNVPNRGDRGFTVYSYSYDGTAATYWLVWDCASPQRISMQYADWYGDFLEEVWGSRIL